MRAHRFAPAGHASASSERVANFIIYRKSNSDSLKGIQHRRYDNSRPYQNQCNGMYFVRAMSFSAISN